MSKKYLDMYHILNKHITIETDENEISQCLNEIKKTHEMYGNKIIHNINQEILKTIRNYDVNNLTDGEKINFYHDCVILHAISSTLYNIPIKIKNS